MKRRVKGDKIRRKGIEKKEMEEGGERKRERGEVR